MGTSVAQVEPGIASRFNTRDDLVRIGFDLVSDTEGERPRLWLVASPLLQGRLLALVEAVLNRKLTAEEQFTSFSIFSLATQRIRAEKSCCQTGSYFHSTGSAGTVQTARCGQRRRGVRIKRGRARRGRQTAGPT